MTLNDMLFIQVIADYGSADDMAFAEVRQALRYVTRDLVTEIDVMSVPAFDTYATGFALGQLAINHQLGPQQLFYVNTAPRKDDKAARTNAAGEGLVYAKLHNGVRIIAVNSGYSLAFITPFAQEIRKIDCSDAGSQFRSRDIFPPPFGLLARGDESLLREDIKHLIPPIPENVICYTDGFGNMKTSINAATLKGMGQQKAIVTINGQSHEAIIGDGIFSVPEGTLVLSAGSSGWKTPDGTEMRFVECVWRGHSAAKLFGHPVGGSAIELKVTD
ncbi:MAG TPA: SAM hydroxide adenosyltransferase [Alphaproteobacteria bacterium]